MITDKTAVENYLLTDIDDAFEAQIEEWIESVQTEMNRMTDRQLVADATAADYTYDGNGKVSMMIDDFVDIDEINVDGTDVTDDCFLYPANKYPKWRVEYESKFKLGKQNVTVTGKRGYALEADIPKDLKFAATVLVAGIVNYANTSNGEVKRESIGRYTVEYGTDSQKMDFDRAMSIIQSYRRVR